MRNPYAKGNRVIGITDVVWQAAIDAVTAWLQAHPDVQEVPDATIRALHPALTNDQVWNEFRKAIGG